MTYLVLDSPGDALVAEVVPAKTRNGMSVPQGGLPSLPPNYILQNIIGRATLLTPESSYVRVKICVVGEAS